MEVACFRLPSAVLIWRMIVQMMLAVDFPAIGGIRQQPRGLLITIAMNWVIRPFTITDLAWLFILWRSLPGSPKQWARRTSPA